MGKPTPPAYTPVAAAAAPVGEEDDLLFTPDDFKYDSMVSSCDISIRYQFIKKVYFLLFLQIFATFTTQMLFFYDIIPRSFILRKIVQIPSFIGSFLLCIVLFCSTTNADDDEDDEVVSRSWFKPIRMKYRTQLVLLGLFTLCESIIISYITVLYKTTTILSAVLLTLIILASTTLFAIRQANYYNKNANLEFQENQSLFKIYNVLWILSTLFLGFGLILMVMPYNSKRELIFSYIGAIIFTIYLYVDSYMILRKVRPNEEIKCCMMLYMDIINLFLNILRILSHNNDD